MVDVFIQMKRHLQLIASAQNQQLIKSLVINCQSLFNKLSPVCVQQYRIYLSQVYAFRLHNIQKAIITLNELLQSEKPQNVLQSLLRISYFQLLSNDFQKANHNLQLAFDQARNPSLKHIANIFLQRLISQQKFMKAVNFQRTGQKNQAITIWEQIYNESLDKEQRYEAGQNIMRLNKNCHYSIIAGVKGYEVKSKSKLNSLERINYFIKVLQFINKGSKKQVQGSLLKLITIAKINTFAKHTNNKEIKAILWDTVINISANRLEGPNAQLLNMNFVKKEYQILNRAQQIFQKYFGFKRKAFKNIKNISGVVKKTESQDEYIEESSNKKSRKNLNLSKNLSIKRQKSEMRSILKNNQMGSIMTKINLTSSGYEKRYFFVKDQREKLYYCDNESDKNSASSYSLKYLQELRIGKQSDALKRKQCEKFQEEQCFTLGFTNSDSKQLNFYVNDINDYEMWLKIFEELLRKESRSMKSVKKSGIKFQ